jgi:hypothetical protein
MEFIIAKELRLNKFTNQEYEYPKNSYKDKPLEWIKYWKKCLKDSGLEELNLINDTNGSCLINLNNIKDEDLEIILVKELKEIDLDKYEDEILPFDGGLVIKNETNKTIIQPQCCGDLGNIKDWLDTYSKVTNTWTKLWIGHPWIYIRKKNNNIELSNYNELEQEEPENIEVAYKIDTVIFSKKLNELIEKQKEVESRIKGILNKVSISNSNAIGKLLAGNF